MYKRCLPGAVANYVVPLIDGNDSLGVLNAEAPQEVLKREIHKANSMVEAGIKIDDVVICEKKPITEGEVVVCDTDRGLKLSHSGDKSTEGSILGVAVGPIRRL